VAALEPGRMKRAQHGGRHVLEAVGRGVAAGGPPMRSDRAAATMHEHGACCVLDQNALDHEISGYGGVSGCKVRPRSVLRTGLLHRGLRREESYAREPG
jgi:hypothetical protein